MKKATIAVVNNGYVVTVVKDGNQTLVDDVAVFVADNIEDALLIIKTNA